MKENLKNLNPKVQKIAKRIADINVWTHDWEYPRGNSVLLYKHHENPENGYQHTHPEWWYNRGKILDALDYSDFKNHYKNPMKITLLHGNDVGIHLPIKRKSIYFSIKGSAIVLQADDTLKLFNSIELPSISPIWQESFRKDNIHFWGLHKDFSVVPVGNVWYSMLILEKDAVVLSVQYL